MQTMFLQLLIYYKFISIFDIGSFFTFKEDLSHYKILLNKGHNKKSIF